MVPEQNTFEYHHPDFVWHSHHFIFGNENPRFRTVSIYLRKQISTVFPGRAVIVISQYFTGEGEWNSATLKFPQIEIMVSCPDFDEIVELIHLGVKIAKKADAFFENPQQWLNLKESQQSNKQKSI